MRIIFFILLVSLIACFKQPNKSVSGYTDITTGISRYYHDTMYHYKILGNDTILETKYYLPYVKPVGRCIEFMCGEDYIKSMNKGNYFKLQELYDTIVIKKDTFWFMSQG